MFAKKFRQLWLMVFSASLGASVMVWLVYRLRELFKQNKQQTIQYLQAGSQVYPTARGPVEASIMGEGPAVLVVHGGAGGYDQGALESKSLEGFKFISVSRPGYLRTPIETGRSPAEQADALAALLDTLGVQRAALIGTSMGGLVGIHFALRHPQRCWGLVLVSAVNAPLPMRFTNLRPLAGLLRTDFLAWVFFHPETLLLFRPTLRDQVAADPDKLDAIDKLIHTAYPVSLRAAGMINDAEQIDLPRDIPLENINIPTLVLHGDADEVVPFEQGVRSAARIPNASFVPVPQGTHYCVLTHMELTRPLILEFLHNQVSADWEDIV